MKACTKPHYLVEAVCVIMLLVCMSGCAPLRRPPEPSLPEQPIAIPPVPPEEPEAEKPVDPRYRASLQLTDQARALLEQGRFDDAIRALEQALGLYPGNGQSCYYMAEAWLEKGNISQATEFNRLAAMYLDDPSWDKRIDRQQREIESWDSGHY